VRAELVAQAGNQVRVNGFNEFPVDTDAFAFGALYPHGFTSCYYIVRGENILTIYKQELQERTVYSSIP
jgi:hypothetical protein